jgi:hypothetical protein
MAARRKWQSAARENHMKISAMKTGNEISQQSAYLRG